MVAALSAACTPAEDDESRLGQQASAMVGGSPSPSTQDEVVFVASPIGGNNVYVCTGTLVAPNLVLLAKHCVAQIAEDPFACTPEGKVGAGGEYGADFNPAGMEVFVGAQFPQVGAEQPAARGAKIFHRDGDACSSDLALLLLAAPIEGAKIAPLRLDKPASVGEPVISVGFGKTGGGFPSQRQTRETVIERMGPYDAQGANEMSLGSGTFSIAGGFLCQGDSGGPAIAKATGAVLGVASQGAVQCGATFGSSYAAVQPFRDLILSAFAEAGQQPLLEEDPNAASPLRSSVAASPTDPDPDPESATSPASPTDNGAADTKKKSTAKKAPALYDVSSTGCSVGRGAPPDVPWAAAAVAGAVGIAIARRRRARTLGQAPELETGPAV
jgi:hypothetical protein